MEAAEVAIIETMNWMVLSVQASVYDSDMESLPESDDESIQPLEEVLAGYDATSFGGPVVSENPFKGVSLEALPDLSILPNESITILGYIMSIQCFNEERVVVLSTESCCSKHLVVEVGTVVVSDLRIVVGRVVEVFGSIDEPFYAITLSNKDISLDKQTQLYCVDRLTKRLDRQSIEKERLMKGSDASNKNNHEPIGTEIDFSDDEKELNYKKQLQRKRPMKKNHQHSSQKRKPRLPMCVTVKPPNQEDLYRHMRK